jgi:hypothetical protein
MFIPGPEYDVDAVPTSLTTQCLADPPDQRKVPGRGERHSRREAGRRKAAPKAEVIRVLVVLDSEAVRSVREPE